MRIIITRFILVILSVILLAFLWEFWLEDILLGWLTEYHKTENLAERVEYIISVSIVALLSLIAPLFMAVQDFRKREKLIRKLEQALSEIKVLQGIIPICCYCKSIRNDEGYYEQIENYISTHSGVDFSHTICPDCAKKYHPQEYESIMKKMQ